MEELPKPPNVGGVMELATDAKTSIRAQLISIQESFAPTLDEPTLSTHGLVSRYNQQNEGAEINGDTAEYLLGEA